MTSQPDDMQLTAYALGELGEAARADVEARLAADPDARAQVDEVRQTAELLRDGLAAEPAPRLTASQRAAIESRAAARAGRSARGGRGLWLRIGVAAAAAAVLIGVCVAVFWGAFGPDRGPVKVAGPSDPNKDGRPELVGTPGGRGKAPSMVGTPTHDPPTTEPATRPSVPGLDANVPADANVPLPAVPRPDANAGPER